jgi:hypothetical protein
MKQWLLENLDTYAMEFLKECLPEKSTRQNTDTGEGAIYIEGCKDGFNNCIDIALNNANNKQNE